MGDFTSQNRLHSSDFIRTPGRVALFALVFLAACSAPKETTTTDAGGLPLASGNLGYGISGGTGILLDKMYFVLLYDTTTLVPQWVSYRLTQTDLDGPAERTNDFRPDPEIPVGHRSELEDYRLSGYDRGHMAPAADFTRSPEAMSMTFLLSNMAPQRPALNRGIWATLEGEVRILAQDHATLWVLTGCLFLDSLSQRTVPQVFIGPHKVAVPTHFFKVILCERQDGSRQMYAFVLANSAVALPGPLKEYLTSVDEVEALSGLDFFSGMEDEEEDRLEAMVAPTWVSD